MANAYASHVKAKYGEISEPSAEHIAKIEDDIFDELNRKVDRISTTTPRSFKLPIFLPTGCNKWHAFNYLRRKGYVMNTEDYCAEPYIFVNLDKDTTSAVFKFRDIDSKRDEDSRKQLEDLFKDPTNLVGTIEYEEEVLLVFKYRGSINARGLSYLRDHIDKACEVTSSWKGTERYIHITVPQSVLQDKQASTSVLTNYIKKHEKYKLRLTSADQAAFDQFCIDCYAEAKSQFESERRLPLILTDHGAFVLELYGFSPVRFSKHVKSLWFNEFLRDPAYRQGKHNKIVDAPMITVTDFFKNLEDALNDGKRMDNEDKAAKRQRILDAYEQDAFTIEHLISGEVVHTFENKAYESIGQLHSSDQERIATAIKKKLERKMVKGVKCTCHVVQRPSDFTVIYKEYSVEKK